MEFRKGLFYHVTRVATQAASQPGQPGVPAAMLRRGWVDGHVPSQTRTNKQKKRGQLAGNGLTRKDIICINGWVDDDQQHWGLLSVAYTDTIPHTCINIICEGIHIPLRRESFGALPVFPLRDREDDGAIKESIGIYASLHAHTMHHLTLDTGSLTHHHQSGQYPSACR